MVKDDSKKPIKVFEVRRGYWTHDFADEEWGGEEGQRFAINSAYEIADKNRCLIEIDFSIEMQERAKKLGIDLYSKTSRKLTEEKKPRRRYDPFD